MIIYYDTVLEYKQCSDQFKLFITYVRGGALNKYLTSGLKKKKQKAQQTVPVNEKRVRIT